MASRSLNFLRNKSISTIVERGTGGRHSDGGVTVAVFGGTGIVGRNLLTRMGRQGVQGIIPHRKKDKWIIHYKPMSDLGQFNFIEFYDIRNDEATEMVVEKSDVVVNCIGGTMSTNNYPLEEVLVTWPDKLSKICKRYNVPRLIHMSAYGASTKSGNEVLKLKAQSERRVKDNFPNAIIMRPVQIFGKADRYFGVMKYLPRLWGNYFIGNGKTPIIKFPLHVADVGQAVLNACTMSKIEGEIFELFGPEGYHLSDLYDFVMSVVDNKTTSADYPRQVREVPMSLLSVYTRLFEMTQPLSRKLPIDVNLVDWFHKTEIPRGMPGVSDLGVKTQDVMSEKILDVVRHQRSFEHYLGTMEETKLPTPVTMEDLHPRQSKNNIVGDLTRSLV